MHQKKKIIICIRISLQHKTKHVILWNHFQTVMYKHVFPLQTHNGLSQQQKHKRDLFPFCLDCTSQAIIFYLYKSQKIAVNILPGAFFLQILLHWVIFKTSFSKHLLSVLHWELMFHMLCLYCGCGRGGAEPACFHWACGNSEVHHAKFKISNKFNMYCAGIRSVL